VKIVGGMVDHYICIYTYIIDLNITILLYYCILLYRLPTAFTAVKNHPSVCSVRTIGDTNIHSGDWYQSY